MGYSAGILRWQVAIMKKKDLVERIEAKWRKFVAVSEPTPIILESMRNEEKTLGDEVKTYLESLNE